MYELIIIGAGPAGISMAAEARNAGIASEQILVLEKGPMHSWAIRKFYPAINLAFNMAQEAMRNICTGTPNLCESWAEKQG